MPRFDCRKSNTSCSSFENEEGGRKCLVDLELDKSEKKSYGSTVMDAANRRISFKTDPTRLTFENLNVFVGGEDGGGCCGRNKPPPKQILKDVSGHVVPGQLVALMGASGSGKTTLLNVINSRNCRGLRVEGSIKVNGKEIGRQITGISAYVQQDDLFIGTLTVREHLIFQALLRLPKSMKRSEKVRRVDEVIFELGLSKCRNTKIGLLGVFKGISGGEAKRLAFASEILTNPSILFCDEPTTGLDSYMAQNVVSVLQTLANNGKTVLCTIHQPASEVYAMFDRILFMAEGRLAYFGSNKEALTFFGSLGHSCPTDFNPADFFVHTLAIQPGKEEECREMLNNICEKYVESEYYKEMSNLIAANQGGNGGETNIVGMDMEKPKKTSRYKSGTVTQITTLSKRSMLNNFRNPRVLYVRTVQKIVMAIFVGLIYLNTTYDQEGVMNINGALFFILAEYSFPAIFGVITILPLEFPVVVREHHNGMYRVLTYYLSKVISFILIYSLDGIIFTCICYFMIGLRRTLSAFLWTLLIGVLLEQCSSAFGTMMSAVSPSFALAVTIVGPIMTVIEMTGGLFINIATIPFYLSWSQYISWFRYGYEAMFIVQWEPVTNITCRSPELSCVPNGAAVLRKFNFEPANFNKDMILMVVLYLAFHFFGYLGLSIRAYKAR